MNATRSVLALGIIGLAALAILLFVRSFRSEPTVPREATPRPHTERQANLEDAPESTPRPNPVTVETPPTPTPTSAPKLGARDPSHLRHRVRVLSPFGGPVEDAVVEVAEWSGRDAHGSTNTDRDGLAVLSFEDRGFAYWIRVDHPHYPAHDEFLERSHGETTITLTEGRPIPVEVIDERTREPIEGLAFLIRTQAESARPLRRVTDAHGTFVVTLPLDRRLTRSGRRVASRLDYSVSEGRVELPFACEPELLDWQARVVRAYDPHNDRAALIECFQSTGFDVTVLQADGRPAVEAHVRVSSSLSTEQIEALIGIQAGDLAPSTLAALPPLDTLQPFQPLSEILTDTNGRATIRRIAPDLDYVISATNASHHFGASGPQPARLGEVRDVTVHLDHDASGLRVHVASDGEASAEGYDVNVTRPDGLTALASRSGQGPATQPRKTEAEEGAFFPVLQPGTYLIEVSRRSTHRTEPVEVVAGTVTETTIRFDGGLDIEGRVVDVDGEPIGGVALAFKADDGSVSQRGAGTGNDGRFVIRGLLPSQGQLTLDNSMTAFLTTPHGEQIVRPANASTIYERLVVDDVMPGGPPLEIVLRAAAKLEGKIDLPDDSAAGRPHEVWLHFSAPGAPESTLWRRNMRVGPERPMPFSLEIPILDRPVILSLFASQGIWIAPDPIIFRSGETVDIGELLPD